MSQLRRSVVAAWAAQRDSLRRGDLGEGVRTLQRLLAVWGFRVGPDDGIWGPRTDAAVVDAQRELSLSADGIVGPLTRARMSFAQAAGYACGEYLPICEGGPLAQGRHPKHGQIPARRGRSSTFGGPDDSGDRGYGQALVPVRPGGSVEALYRQHPRLVELGLFRGGLTDPLPMTTMLGRDCRAGISYVLRPESYYCAMRWRRSGRPIPETSRVLLVADSGRMCVVATTDYGPARWTKRVIDISPGTEGALGIGTDGSLLIAWAPDDSELGPVLR